VIYTDFSKAFDKLNHNILLSKLSDFGFSPSLLSLLKSYMSDMLSIWDSVRFALQLILGPLRFLLFINDINEIFTVDSLLYADDLKLYSRIHNMHDCKGCFFKFGVEVGVGESIESAPLV
jgi:ribonuclease P/MRP protein subunit RPP40